MAIKKLDQKIQDKIKEYRKMLGDVGKLPREKWVMMLHEVMRGSLVHLCESALNGEPRGTGAWKDLLEKAYYLLDSAGEGYRNGQEEHLEDEERVIRHVIMIEDKKKAS